MTDRAGLRVIVCGARNFRSPGQVFVGLDRIHESTPIAELMQGGASGVDTFASQWAASKGIKRYVCHADWKQYGKAAGPIRNARMLEWNPDLVVAFPGGRGTADMVRRSREAGIEVMEIPR